MAKGGDGPYTLPGKDLMASGVDEGYTICWQGLDGARMPGISLVIGRRRLVAQDQDHVVAIVDEATLVLVQDLKDIK